MAGGGSSKSALSGNVLQMKFMKRSALRLEKEKSEEERKYDVDDEHWVLDLPKTQQKESSFVIEPSYERCENLMYGRLSFKGFNQEVEKLMKSRNADLGLEEAERRENETNVNDKEMADRYESLIGTVSRKFQKKRERQTDQSLPESSSSGKKLKRQFKKPSDD